MNKAFINNQSVETAGKWNELTGEQLRRLMVVFLTPDATEEYVETRLVAILLQLWKRPQLAGVMLKMPLLEVATLRLLTRAFLQQPVELTKQLLPKLRPMGLGRTLYGPLDGLAGLSFEEWISCENHYFNFREHKKTVDLQRLVAVLYRHRRRSPLANGDQREDFNQHTVESRAQLLQQLPQTELQAVLFFYDSCRTHLVKRAPELFPGREWDDEPAPVATNPTRNYMLMLRELAGSPDRFDVIGKQPVANVFFDLNQRILDANALQAAIDAKRNG
jgi:hypothetical protein